MCWKDTPGCATPTGRIVSMTTPSYSKIHRWSDGLRSHHFPLINGFGCYCSASLRFVWRGLISVLVAADLPATFFDLFSWNQPGIYSPGHRLLSEPLKAAITTFSSVFFNVIFWKTFRWDFSETQKSDKNNSNRIRKSKLTPVSLLWLWM